MAKRLRGPIPATPPVRRKRGPKFQPPTKILITSFRAEGSIRGLAEQIYGGVVVGDPRHGNRQERYLTIQSQYPTKGSLMFTQSPGIWVSNESFALGRVNFEGRVSRKALFALLNDRLNLDQVEEIKTRVVNKTVKGKVRQVRESYTVKKTLRKAMDFRRVYPNWKWKRQVVEVLIVPQYRQSAFKASLEDGRDRRVVESENGDSRNG